MTYKLASLPYEYNALEPYIDARTVEIHHDKHAAAYVNNLNTAVKSVDGFTAAESPIELLKNLSSVPESIQTTVRNNAGGDVNHTLYFKILTPGGPSLPQGKLAETIDRDFGSFEKLKEKLSQLANTRFGSGWSWLVTNKEGKLNVLSTPNQDNPALGKDFGFDQDQTTILGIDVWEHSYYLKYQNRRPEYVTNIFNLINWSIIEDLYLKAQSCCC